MYDYMAFSLRILMVMLLSLLMVTCSQNRHQQQVNFIKDHVRNFYTYLEKDKVSSALLENEEIEALASDMERHLLQQATRMDATQKANAWVMVKTAREAAAENWLALARYFVVTNQIDRARRTYQRIVDSYDQRPYESYRDRAKQGLLDLDRMVIPSS